MQSSDLSQYFSGRAIVDETIEPGKRGRVRFRGSYWFAWCDRPVKLLPGEAVEVVGNRNVTAIVIQPLA